MSRIHEALKKAELESAADFISATVTEKEGVGGQVPAPEKPPRRIQEFPLEPLSFENLIARCSKADWKSNSNAALVADPQVELRRSERFRMLRSRLCQLRATRKLGSVLVTSALPGEGKTFVASNLAVIIARQPGAKVLLLDADIRSPQLHISLGAPSRPGLTEYLSEDAYLEDILQHGKQGNLCFIPAGKSVANPGELIAGPRMKALLELVDPIFDWIIIDAPPVLLVSDPLVLANMVDGVLQVVAAGSTDREDAQKACREFQEKTLLGVVLNRGVRPIINLGNTAIAEPSR